MAHDLIPQIASWGAAAVTLHGRTRQQRYSRQADWDYIRECGRVAAGAGVPLVGNGDVMSYQDWVQHMETDGVTTCMIARGALIKPWIFTGEAAGWGWRGLGRWVSQKGGIAPHPSEHTGPADVHRRCPTRHPPHPQRSASSGYGTSAPASGLTS